MHELVEKLPRRVIPRWRDFATTAALGELGALGRLQRQNRREPTLRKRKRYGLVVRRLWQQVIS